MRYLLYVAAAFAAVCALATSASAYVGGGDGAYCSPANLGQAFPQPDGSVLVCEYYSPGHYYYLHRY